LLESDRRQHKGISPLSRHRPKYARPYKYEYDMSQVEFPKKLVTFCKEKLLREPAKRVVISGPSGFLGSRVVWSALDVHALRQEHGLPPGEIVLLSASPGKLMDALVKKYGRETMKTIRASRVDYRTQHDVDTVYLSELSYCTMYEINLLSAYEHNMFPFVVHSRAVDRSARGTRTRGRKLRVRKSGRDC
jgi:hypothetical protein